MVDRTDVDQRIFTYPPTEVTSQKEWHWLERVTENFSVENLADGATLVDLIQAAKISATGFYERVTDPSRRHGEPLSTEQVLGVLSALRIDFAYRRATRSDQPDPMPMPTSDMFPIQEWETIFGAAVTDVIGQKTGKPLDRLP